MTPYYEQDGITIYLGDCREVMPSLESDSIDLLLTDPPYGGLVGGQDRNKFSNSDVGRYVESSAIGDLWNASFDWTVEAARVARLGALVFTSHHWLPETALAFPNWRRAALVTWHKHNTPPTGKNVPRFTEEYVWGLAKRPGLSWDQFKSTLISLPTLSTGMKASRERLTDPGGQALHPTQKPLSVLRRLLCIGGDIVLDPFMGTGTTLRAAKDLGRQAIGIEIDERYCEMAVARLAQLSLALG